MFKTVDKSMIWSNKTQVLMTEAADERTAGCSVLVSQVKPGHFIGPDFTLEGEDNVSHSMCIFIIWHRFCFQL